MINCIFQLYDYFLTVIIIQHNDLQLKTTENRARTQRNFRTDSFPSPLSFFSSLLLLSSIVSSSFFSFSFSVSLFISLYLSLSLFLSLNISHILSLTLSLSLWVSLSLSLFISLSLFLALSLSIYIYIYIRIYLSPTHTHSLSFSFIPTSAHGVPESYIQAGDPYKRHIEECVTLISKEVAAQLSSDRTRPSSISKLLGLQLAGAIAGKSAPTQFHLSFQSRVGPVQWLK